MLWFVVIAESLIIIAIAAWLVIKWNALRRSPEEFEDPKEKTRPPELDIPEEERWD